MSTSEKPKTAKVATQCAKCHRAVWTSDVNADGVCVLCAPVAPVTELDDDGLGRHTVSLPEMADQPHPDSPEYRRQKKAKGRK